MLTMLWDTVMAKQKKKDTDPLVYDRGQRAKLVRLALRMTRPAVARECGIAIGSLQNWEDARFGGLGERGAKRLVKAYGERGVVLTVEWLLYGIGMDPLAQLAAEKKAPAAKPQTLDKTIQAELAYFHQQHSNAIDTIMPDNAMAPRILPDDIIAGRRYFQSDIQKAIGRDCIIQTAEGGLLVRRIDSGNEKQGYTLICPYTADKKSFPDQEDIELFSAAPVMWIRSK